MSMREALLIHRTRLQMTGPVQRIGLLTAAILAGRAKGRHEALRDDVRDFQTYLDAMEQAAESRVSTNARAAFRSAGLDPSAVEDWGRITNNVRYWLPKGTSAEGLSDHRERVQWFRAQGWKVPESPFELPILWFANCMQERLDNLPLYRDVYFHARVVAPGQPGLLVAHRYKMGCRASVIRRLSIWLCAESEDAEIKRRVNDLITTVSLSL